jgi:acyl carrier protein
MIRDRLTSVSGRRPFPVFGRSRVREKIASHQGFRRPSGLRRVGCTGNFNPAGDDVPAETHVEKGPLDRQQVFELVRDQLADILEVEPSTIRESSSFAEDLDADSLALIELVEALEEELGERSVGFRIEDEDLEDLRTVRDAVDYVVAKLGAT